MINLQNFKLSLVVQRRLNPSYLHLQSHNLTLCSCISYLIFLLLSLVLFISLSLLLSLSLFMPFISEYFLIFSCFNIALPTCVTLSLLLFSGISFELFILISIFLDMYISFFQNFADTAILSILILCSFYLLFLFCRLQSNCFIASLNGFLASLFCVPIYLLIFTLFLTVLSLSPSRKRFLGISHFLPLSLYINFCCNNIMFF